MYTKICGECGRMFRVQESVFYIHEQFYCDSCMTRLEEAAGIVYDEGISIEEYDLEQQRWEEYLEEHE